MTALVGINYIIICRHFPDGGGVYSAARTQGRLLAVVGALLLLADFMVTAALSGWAGLSYITAGAGDVAWIGFLHEHIGLATIVMLIFMGGLNFFGPKHSGSLAVVLSVPTVLVVLVLIAISAPHLTTRFLEPRHENYGSLWVQFVGVILALSGAEVDREPHRCDEARPGLDLRTSGGGKNIAQSDLAGSDRSRWRDGFARLGHAFSPKCARNEHAPGG